jgi:hypothetical protein
MPEGVGSGDPPLDLCDTYCVVVPDSTHNLIPVPVLILLI